VVVFEIAGGGLVAFLFLDMGDDIFLRVREKQVARNPDSY